MEPCIFCRIAAGEFATPFVYQDSRVVAFHDINPQAPVHVVVCPRAHFPTIREIADESLLGGLIQAARMSARTLGLADYRLVINTGTEAGQAVPHAHLHVLGGRTMNWPPG